MNIDRPEGFSKEVRSTKVRPADALRWGFTTLASLDNAKADKARKYGYLNAILYMAPADTAGVGDLCPHKGACADLCLGEHSGQAAIGKVDKNAVIRARRARAVAYMHHREEFMHYIMEDITRLRLIAISMDLRLCYRFNGSTDVGVPVWLISMFPDVVFIDYTKNPNRIVQYLSGKFPSNYHLTFSYDPGNEKVPSNERLALRFISQGANVAVVFGDGRPAEWHGFPVIDGDRHDIRTPEMDGRGKVIGLTPKGRKAKASASPFIVRQAA